MEKLNINLNIQRLQPEELSAEEQKLIECAIKATANSYAKYSHFNVGAALQLADGSIICGANQENACFPAGLCAERTALFAAQAQHPDQRVVEIAIAAKNENGLTAQPITPCGGCRQVLLEVEDRYQQPIRILLYGTRDILRVGSAKDLMPLAFLDENMR